MSWIVVYFENKGIPAIGLSPLVRIRNIEDGTIVAEDSMEEVGNGFYRFDFVIYDITNDYVMLVDGGSSLSSTERFIEGATGEYGYIYSNIYLMTDNIDCRVNLMKKLSTNRLSTIDGNSDNWVLYEDDGVTPLLIFDASDVNGDVIIQSTSMASKRSKAKE